MITEREPPSKLSRLQYDDSAVSNEMRGGGNHNENHPGIETPVDCRTAFANRSTSAAALMKRESRSSVCAMVDDDDSDSNASNLAIDVHSDPNSPNPNSNMAHAWDTEGLLHPGMSNSLDLAAQLKRKEVFNARKQREFIPDNKKDETYWDRRRRNNEAAKRSREKRRLNDMVLETRVIELTKENTFLRTQLVAIRDQFGIIGENLVAPEHINNSFPTTEVNHHHQHHHHQVALNLSKRAKLLSPMLGAAGGVVHSHQTAAVTMMAAAAAASNPAPPVAALRSLVMASALQQQQQQQQQQQKQTKVNGRHPLASNGKPLMSEHCVQRADGRTNGGGGGTRINGNNNNANGGGGEGNQNNANYGEYWNLNEGKFQGGSIRGNHPSYSHHHLQQQQQASPHQFVVPNGHHHNVEHSPHQGALLSALNGATNNHESNGYAGSRYPSRYSPTYSNATAGHPVTVEFTSRSNDPPIAAHQSNSRHGYVHNGNLYRQHPHFNESPRLPTERNGADHPHAHHYDDSCSNCSSSGDEGHPTYSNGNHNNNGQNSAPPSPYETVVVDVDQYSVTSNGAAANNDANQNTDAQLHLPHKLRHKPRLSECSIPALSPPSRASPPVHHQRDSRASSTSSESPEVMVSTAVDGSCDERDTLSPEVQLNNRRKRKASVFIADISPSSSGPLETENTQLKVEMQRLAIEVASLKDILFCKKDGTKDGNPNEGNGSTKSDASSRDSGFITEVDKDDELSCG